MLNVLMKSASPALMLPQNEDSVSIQTIIYYHNFLFRLQLTAL